MTANLSIPSDCNECVKYIKCFAFGIVCKEKCLKLGFAKNDKV